MAIIFTSAYGPIKFFATVRESHTSEVQIPSHPLESGSTVQDHVYNMPKMLSLEIVGPSPPARIKLPVLPDVILPDVLSPNAFYLYNALLLLQETREPFYLLTGLTFYQNLLIQSLNAERTAKNTNNLMCNITLKQVQFVDTAPRESLLDQLLGKLGGKNSLSAGKTPASEITQRGTVASQPASLSSGEVARLEGLGI